VAAVVAVEDKIPGAVVAENENSWLHQGLVGGAPKPVQQKECFQILVFS